MSRHLDGKHVVNRAWRVSSLILLLPMVVAANGSTPRLEGVWRSEGYGRILEIKDDRISFFDVTKVSCVLRETQPLDQFLRDIDRVNLSEKNRFSYYREGEINRYEHTRLSQLSDACAKAKNGALNLDPEYNFDVFWHSFNENYAFFETRKVDWQAVYEQYRPLVTKATSKEELYDVLSKVIRLLNDGHVTLQGDGLPLRRSGHPGTLKRLLQKELVGGEEATTQKVVEVAKGVIAEYSATALQKQAARGKLAWGWAAEGIGYVSIDSMFGYLDDPDASLGDTLRYVDATMDQVISDLAGAKGFIVDARWNNGGEDSIALYIAGHFTDQVLLAFTKRTRNGATLTKEQEIFIPSHASKKFTGPVVYLCAKDTVSAAEIFSLAMMAMPNVTTLGEPTYGVLSDMHLVRLPNGWRISMSNEVYTAIDGVVYEGAGIPVDVHVAPENDATLQSYIRLGLQRATALLRTSSRSQ